MLEQPHNSNKAEYMKMRTIESPFFILRIRKLFLFRFGKKEPESVSRIPAPLVAKVRPGYFAGQAAGAAALQEPFLVQQQPLTKQTRVNSNTDSNNVFFMASLF